MGSCHNSMTVIFLGTYVFRLACMHLFSARDTYLYYYFFIKILIIIIIIILVPQTTTDALTGFRILFYFITYILIILVTICV